MKHLTGKERSNEREKQLKGRHESRDAQPPPQDKQQPKMEEKYQQLCQLL